MYINDNLTVSLTQETNDLYVANATVKAPSIFKGNEVSPFIAAISQIGGLYALCIAATFIAMIIIGKVA